MRRKTSQTESDWVVALSGQPTTTRAQRQQPRSPAERLEPARPATPPGRASRVKPVRGPSRGRSTFGVLNGALTVLMVLMVLAGGTGFAMKYAFDEQGPVNHSAIVVIPQGEGAIGIAYRLQQDGVVADRKVVLAGYYFERAKAWLGGGKLPNLRAGEYEIPKNASPRQVLDALLEGKAILEKVTIPEGLTSYQIVELLKRQSNLSGDIAEIPTEGSLLPETYRFSRNTSRAEIIARMQADNKKYIAQQWERRSSTLPFKTADEAIILASIVEKEARNERDRVAGVFINRLAKKMRLQSDPTIIYVVTSGKGNLGRGITRSEIDTKNEYNTYQIEGLPPTPICNPGRQAIDAVMNPATTGDLYFVADGTGNHAFASNIRDHQNNVKRWRQLERDAKAKAAADAAGAAQDQTAGPGVALDMPGVAVSADATAADGDPVPPDPTESAQGVAGAPMPDTAPVATASAKAKPVKPKTP